MAKMIRLNLSPAEADLLHWSILLAKQDVQEFDQRTGQPSFASGRDLKLVLDKLIKAKRRAAG